MAVLSNERPSAELPKGLRVEIGQRHFDTLDRLILGEDDAHWGVMAVCGDGQRDQPFCKVSSTSTFDVYFQEQRRCIRDPDDVKFVALGAFGYWAVGINAFSRTSGPPSLKKAMEQAKTQGKQVLVGTLNANGRAQLTITPRTSYFPEWIRKFRNG